MPQVAVNGINVYYERHGKGAPLLLICGFTSHLKMWDRCLPHLAKHFEVIVFDNRGAGRTEATPPPYTIEELADDAIGLLDAIQVKKAHMAGVSMGAAIVQSIGLRHAERIDKGVLIAPFSALPSTAIMQAHSIAKLFQAEVDPPLALETILPWIYSNDYLSDPKRIEKTITEMIESPYPQPPEGYAGQLEALSIFNLTERLSEIETEMLIIAGEEDLYTPMYTTQTLEKNLSNATLKVVPKVGHMLHVEAEDLVVEEICAFCKH